MQHYIIEWHTFLCRLILRSVSRRFHGYWGMPRSQEEWMNRAHFMFYLLYVCDLHNRREESKLKNSLFLWYAILFGYHHYKVFDQYQYRRQPVSKRTPREDPGMSWGSSGQHGGLCLKKHQRRIPGCPGDPLDSTGARVWGNTKGGSRDVQGILRTAGGPISERTPREDPGMTRRSSGQHGGLCLRGHQGRIPGFLGNPPDSMGACVWRDTKEGPGMSKVSSRQHGGPCLRGHQGRILGCPGDPLDSMGALMPREDPGMSRGSCKQHGGLCLRGHQGRIPGCPGDPLDSMGAHVWGDTRGGS